LFVITLVVASIYIHRERVGGVKADLTNLADPADAADPAALADCGNNPSSSSSSNTFTSSSSRLGGRNDRRRLSKAFCGAGAILTRTRRKDMMHHIGSHVEHVEQGEKECKNTTIAAQDSIEA
jgi:hypothetical protein